MSMNRFEGNDPLARAMNDVLGRTSGCGDSVCHACQSNRDSITALVAEAAAVSAEDAQRLRDIARVLQDICPEEMTDEGVWLMKWVNARAPLPVIARTCDICGTDSPHADNCPNRDEITCGRPAGHTGDHLPQTTIDDDLTLSTMPEKGGIAMVCGAFISNAGSRARTLESDIAEDRH